MVKLDAIYLPGLRIITFIFLLALQIVIWTSELKSCCKMVNSPHMWQYQPVGDRYRHQISLSCSKSMRLNL